MPPLEEVADRYGLTQTEARVVKAIWHGRGLAVMSEKIFDAMYIDDPEGGPSSGKMYRELRLALCHIGNKLDGSGIRIEAGGYRRGWRLALDAKPKSAVEPESGRQRQ